MSRDGRVALLLAAWGLKDVPREGWRLRGVGEGGSVESVAAHAWGTALLCMLFADDAGVDREVALEMALVHDVAEVDTGDVATLLDAAARSVTAEEKTRLEVEAMDRLTGLAPDVTERLRSRWQAYEAREGDAARFVRDMNLIDMVVQAWWYERMGRAAAGELDEFFTSARSRIDTPFARGLLAEIEVERDVAVDRD